MKRFALAAIAAACLCVAGCRISRDIIDLTPPPGQVQLQELERHLRYQDPDAGRPDYIRIDSTQ